MSEHKHKHKRLTKIEKEIRAMQKSDKHLIPKSCFKRVVDEYLGDKRISHDALHMLQEEAENHLVNNLNMAGNVARTCNRDTVTDKHLRLVSEIKKSTC